MHLVNASDIIKQYHSSVRDRSLYKTCIMNGDAEIYQPRIAAISFRPCTKSDHMFGVERWRKGWRKCSASLWPSRGCRASKLARHAERAAATVNLSICRENIILLATQNKLVQSTCTESDQCFILFPQHITDLRRQTQHLPPNSLLSSHSLAPHTMSSSPKEVAEKLQIELGRGKHIMSEIAARIAARPQTDAFVQRAEADVTGRTVDIPLTWSKLSPVTTAPKLNFSSDVFCTGVTLKEGDMMNAVICVRDTPPSLAAAVRRDTARPHHQLDC